MSRVNRRTVLGSMLAVGAASPFLNLRAYAQDPIHMLSWGWGYDKAINDAVASRFKDASVELEIGTNAANYAKLLAQRSNPILSGGLFNGAFSYRGFNDKLWKPLDRSFIPNAANVDDVNFLETGGVVFGVQPYGLIYNPQFVEEPKSYLDLFDPKYKGKIGLSDYYFDGFGLTSKALGKDADDVPAGIAEWEKHKDNIGPWNQSPAQVADLVERGELWIAFTFGGIAAGAIAAGKKIAFTIPSEGASAVSDVVHILDGIDDKTTELTSKIAGMLFDDEAQLAFTRNVFTSPVSKTAKIPDDLASNPALLSPEKSAALFRPDLRVGAERYGQYKNLVNRRLKI